MDDMVEVAGCWTWFLGVTCDSKDQAHGPTTDN